MKSTIIANITWNPFRWRELYHNPHAGHRYAREHPGNESLNFYFDKPIDTDGKVYGHVQWRYPPKDFSDGGVIIFYTRNLDAGRGEIVGIYGDARILKPSIRVPYRGFKNNKLWLNIQAAEKYSMQFPIALQETKYKTLLKAKGRLVPQVGFRKIQDPTFSERVLRDEIAALSRSGIPADELRKLKSIFAFVSGKSYAVAEMPQEDTEEQDEIYKELKGKEALQTEKLTEELRNLKPTDPEEIAIGGKTYSRDSKTILSLKILRGFKCQICGQTIPKRNGGYYVEAAHIIPKREKGPELPSNILILCPNHHKEFDFGTREILVHNQEVITFRLNGVEHSSELKV